MQTVYKGTTPSITLSFDTELNLAAADSIVVTFATDHRRILFEKSYGELDVGEHTITVTFTQEQTLALKAGPMLIQMNALIGDVRICSDIAKLQWTENLKNEVMV